MKTSDRLIYRRRLLEHSNQKAAYVWGKPHSATPAEAGATDWQIQTIS